MELKVMGTGSKIFTSDLLGVTEKPSVFLLLDSFPINPSVSKTILVTDLMYIPHPREHCLSPTRCCHPAGRVTKSWNDYFTWFLLLG